MYSNLYIALFSVNNNCKIIFTVSGGAILKYFGGGGGASTRDDGGTGKESPCLLFEYFFDSATFILIATCAPANLKNNF